MRPLSSRELETIGWAQWFSLLSTAVPRVAGNTTGIVRYWFGARGDPLPEPLSVEPPKTAWTDAADSIAAVHLKKRSVWEHSKRTWYFAMALALHDNKPLDSEMVYVASMLHDAGLFVEDRADGFAAAGAKLALMAAAEANADEERAKAVADAIKGHTSVKPPTVLSRYIQDGSVLDVAGARIQVVDPYVIVRGLCEWPSIGFRQDLRESWDDECRRFPYGRAAYARRPSLLMAAARVAPLP